MDALFVSLVVQLYTNAQLRSPIMQLCMDAQLRSPIVQPYMDAQPGLTLHDHVTDALPGHALYDWCLHLNFDTCSSPSHLFTLPWLPKRYASKLLPLQL